jgi:hypothetical protein
MTSSRQRPTVWRKSSTANEPYIWSPSKEPGGHYSIIKTDLIRATLKRSPTRTRQRDRRPASAANVET